MTDFAEALQRLMRKRRLTASDLAAKIWGRYISTEGKNVARGRDRISVWLAGKSVPTRMNLAKLAAGLGVGIEDLMPSAAPPAEATLWPDPEPLWSRDRMAAWMYDHCLDGEEPYR
jgi:transcriptional regulator with XRE-family HTH domain